MLRADEARQAAAGVADQAKTAARWEKQQAALDADRREIVNMLASLKEPETKNKLRGRFSAGHRRFDTAFASLAADDTIQPADVENVANGQNYDGWGLKNESE